MNSINLPPLPLPGIYTPEACAIIRLYLAVWNDLSVEEGRLVAAHVRTCADCAREQQILTHSTRLIANLDASEPSRHIDRAVMAAITARGRENATLPPRSLAQARTRRRRRPLSVVAAVVAAAVLLTTILTSTFFITGSHQQQAFALPTDLSWNGYVLYQKQTMTNARGNTYEVTSYYQMADKSMNVETVMDGKLDVVAVKGEQGTLGLDMMHHVAQWGADSWCGDESMFDLDQLRNALHNGSAVYQGTEQFNGQQVYRIHYTSGDILLLDMNYMPVNVLEVVTNTSSGKPMYDTLQWLSSASVPNSMWDMNIPADFTMGKLPARP